LIGCAHVESLEVYLEAEVYLDDGYWVGALTSPIDFA